MKHWGLDDEIDSRYVRPARDAERIEYNSDHSDNKGDSYGHLGEFLEERSAHEERLAGEHACAPIGLFDSGAGGLTILSALRQELPHEDYIYLGDTAHNPYGMRSEDEIIDLSLKISRFLIDRGAKLIVVACNTASQFALNILRATFSVPFVGVVPAVKPAARATRRGRIGVAATNQAVRAAYLRQLIDDFAEGIQVHAVGCPELVELVERGELDGPRVEKELRHALQPLLAQNIDVLVLGCTHFPALRGAIERVVGSHVQVIDSGPAIARRVHSILEAESMEHSALPDAPKGQLQIWCSGDPQSFSEVASKVLGYSVVAQQARI